MDNTLACIIHDENSRNLHSTYSARNIPYLKELWYLFLIQILLCFVSHLLP